MANIRTDKRTPNNENVQYAHIKSKHAFANGNRSVQKAAFSEIKNVMHNKIGDTPLKGNASKIDGLPNAFNPSKSLCNEVLRKQQLKLNSVAPNPNKLEKKQKSKGALKSYREPAFDESLFDSWDRNRECCRNSRSDVDIWSEMAVMEMEKSISQSNASCQKEEEQEKNLFEAPVDFDDLEKYQMPDMLDMLNLDLMEDEFNGDGDLKFKNFNDLYEELPF